MRVKEYRIRGNFRMSNFRITAKWSISNGFIFEVPPRPPCEKLRCPLRHDKMFSIESIARGYHVYQRVCEASVGEGLTCQGERGTLVDPISYVLSLISTYSVNWVWWWLVTSRNGVSLRYFHAFSHNVLC